VYDYTVKKPAYKFACVQNIRFLSFNMTYMEDLLISKLHNNFERKLIANSKKQKQACYIFLCAHVH
jgi:hypothetical protein